MMRESAALPAPAQTAPSASESSPAPREEEARIDALFAQIDAHEAESPAPDPGTFSLRSARVLHQERQRALVRFRGSPADVPALIAPEVDPELIGRAVKNGDSVLLECERGRPPLVVGVLQTRIPRELVLDADKVRIEGREELTLVSGRAGVRLRKDGDLEMVATRISAASRGFFKLVGRMLRLN
jgi:hypothetical protein